MALDPGTRVGPYEILSSIGAGGMGEVYRARDTKLGRDVALKILPEVFGSDPDRLARFEREARILATLNHPHIAQIHGFEQASVTALVMELVEGEDLSQRIARGAIPIDEALLIARQIAAALEAAHERGIIHRDLKPANVKLRDDGTVKVLDFGLAKALAPVEAGTATRQNPDSSPANSPTMTSPPRMTMQGVILGTAAYMSPEQAKGKPVDKRADVWAFGCVLYEMLSGRAAFASDSVAETIGSVLTRDPDWSLMPPDTPHGVTRLLRRCLAKDPRHRLRDIGDASIELEHPDDVEPPPLAHAARRRGLPAWSLAVSIILSAATAAAVTAWFGKAAAPPRSVVRFDLIARNLQVDPHRHPLISPDGRRIAWAAGGSLWLRELDRTESHVLAADVDPLHLAWSPDSAQIMFFSANRLWRVRTTGGEPVVIADAAFRRGASSPGAAWLDDGRIVFASSATGTGLLAVDARGGTLQPFLETQPGISDFHSPSPLPGGRGILAVLDRERVGTDTILVVADGRLHTVIQEPGAIFEAPVYSPPGFVLYERQGTDQGIWAIPFSLERLTPTGAPFLVVANASWPSVSTDGTLVHTRGDSRAVFGEIAIVDRASGTVRAVGQPANLMTWPRVSSDGRRVVAALSDGSAARDLYSFDVATGTRTRLTFGANPAWPRWGLGDRVIFESGRPGTGAPSSISVVSVEAGGQPEPLVSGAFDADISSDGRWLVYDRPSRERGSDILALPLEPRSMRPADGEHERPVVSSPSNEYKPAIHPSGAFLAYLGADSGRFELYVTRFPNGRGKWQVTTSGVDYARWTPSGDGLLYARGSRVMEVPIALQPSVTVGTPRVVLDADGTRAVLSPTFDVTSDGKAIVFIRRPLSDAEAQGTITVIQNWAAELEQKAVKR